MTLYPFLHNLARLFVAFICRIEIQGQDRLDREGAYILSPNHVVTWDVPIGLAISPAHKRFTVLAADKWLRVPPIRWLFNQFDAVWVRRGEVDRAALRGVLTHLKAGQCVGVAPEGTRTRSGALQQARSGVAWLALQSGVPVIPVAWWGHEHIGFLRRPLVHIRIGEPWMPDPALDLGANTTNLMRCIAAMLPETYRGVYA